MSENTTLKNCGFLLDPPEARAQFRCRYEDFLVSETIPFQPAGFGSHRLLKVRKTGWNTVEVVRWLAEVYGIEQREIGFCGLKDRNAITEQYFSVPGNGSFEDMANRRELAGASSADSVPAGILILEDNPHDRKLRRGAHRSNDFVITLRHFNGDREKLNGRLKSIRQNGFPNYFGEQRFGREGQNVEFGRRLLASRKYRRPRGNKQKLQVSAVRSWLFNQVLSNALRNGQWNRIEQDDLMILDGSRSFFCADSADETLQQRLDAMDIHKSGPLWGIPDKAMTSCLYQREREVLTGYEADCDLLERRGFRMDRRPMRAKAAEFSWEWVEIDALRIQFQLMPGVFATALLRELVSLEEMRPIPVAAHSK